MYTLSADDEDLVPSQIESWQRTAQDIDSVSAVWSGGSLTTPFLQSLNLFLDIKQRWTEERIWICF